MEPHVLFGLDPLPGNKPALHGRLRRSLDERTDDEEHWAFRAIGARHHTAALNRIRNASTAAGLTEGVPKRKLFVLRNVPWSGGARTKAAKSGKPPGRRRRSSRMLRTMATGRRSTRRFASSPRRAPIFSDLRAASRSSLWRARATRKVWRKRRPWPPICWNSGAPQSSRKTDCPIRSLYPTLFPDLEKGP